MKIPAIRATIGTWVYYLATMRFEDISKYVKRVDKELHNSELLREMLQRSITNNYKSIASYIETQNERFFNALVLAVYDGTPTWHEVRLEYETGEEFYDLGILELTGEEKIFPVDGQHRVEGIKKVIQDTDKFNDEQIPVIFIGHRTDAEGMQRSRRLFSTLNRYAKPVSMRDIIALDEDDVVAIASRELIDSHPLFTSGRLLDSKTKAVPESDSKVFTSIITFYECNLELLWLLICNKEIYNSEGIKVKGRSKLKEYIRKRPDDDVIVDFIEVCNRFWNELILTYKDLGDYLNNPPDTTPYRNRQGGNILFRPVALIPFVKAAVRVASSKSMAFSEVFAELPISLLSINNPIWRNIIWNNEKGTMIVNNQKLTERILLFFWDKSLLSEKEIAAMRIDIKSLRQISDEEDLDSLLDDAIEFS